MGDIAARQRLPAYRNGRVLAILAPVLPSCARQVPRRLEMTWGSLGWLDVKTARRKLLRGSNGLPHFPAPFVRILRIFRDRRPHDRPDQG